MRFYLQVSVIVAWQKIGDIKTAIAVLNNYDVSMITNVHVHTYISR